MQKIISIHILLDVPTQVPTNAQHICTAFVGSELRLYYLAQGEDISYETAVFKLVNLSIEDRIPDGFRLVGPVAKQRWDSDNLLLFVR